MIKPDTIRRWFIYKITNPSGRIYIGITANLTRRRNNYKHGCFEEKRIIAMSIKKHGFDNHTMEVIDSFISDKSYATGKEMFWIRTYMSNQCKYRDGNGMNSTDGGGGLLGHTFTHSAEAKAKISLAHKGKPLYKLRGIKRSEEFKRNLSEKKKGKKKMGIKMPNSTREALMKANVGCVRSREVIEKNRKSKIEAWGKCIIQYSANGEFIKEFPAIRVASVELNISRSLITGVLKGKRSQTRGYIFKYK